MSTAREERTGGKRLRYIDVRPYTLPSALVQLTGPVTGRVELPRSLAWGPRRTFDVADDEQRRMLYELVVQEVSTESELALFLDRSVLVELWPRLTLPARCREVWQERFPELARLAAA